MIKELRSLFKKDSSKDYFITAAPQVILTSDKIPKMYINIYTFIGFSVHFRMPCWVMSLVKLAWMLSMCSFTTTIARQLDQALTLINGMIGPKASLPTRMSKYSLEFLVPHQPLDPAMPRLKIWSLLSRICQSTRVMVVSLFGVCFIIHHYCVSFWLIVF